MKNIMNILIVFITYGIPVLSFVYQICKDLADKKAVENIVNNYRNTNNSQIDLKDVNVQNGNIVINNSQNINTVQKKEIDKFNEERLENLKFLAKILYNLSIIFILILFGFNTYMVLETNNATIPSLFESLRNREFSLLANVLMMALNKTINNSFAMLCSYSILIFSKYIIQKYKKSSIIGFFINIISYIFALAFLNNNVLDKLNIAIAIIIYIIVILSIFFSLSIFVYRLAGLERKYQASYKSRVVNYFQTICTLIPPIIVILVNFFIN
ncbi:hypothetical protein K5Q29_07955 [Streptococcus sp. 2018037]|uniref:hypothetical protein n=1 Tax=Streptococcus TaxID=1301 RepID=UPI000CF5A591|nr:MULTISPECIES: hypothetical protein [Streptococcus]MBM7268225.1 hypothetical protein [Streptococcus suis]MBY0753352.1 hypothetical protein [Streptococcus sp. 2018037]